MLLFTGIMAVNLKLLTAFLLSTLRRNKPSKDPLSELLMVIPSGNLEKQEYSAIEELFYRTSHPSL